MRSPFDGFPEDVITTALADGWGLTATELRYFPEGGGAYHWIADSSDGRRAFVTCDDLDTKPWLGSNRDDVFAGLTAAYRTATDLRAADLAFVVAPILTADGATAIRIDERHSISVSPYVDGDPGRWGEPVTSDARQQVMTALAQLHRVEPPGQTILPLRGLDVPGRDDLDTALDELDVEWHGGPLSDATRTLLLTHNDVIVRALTDLDRLAAELSPSDATAVITHGEPHPGNLLWTSTGLVVVDWDTVARARPERDLWMLDDGSGTLARAYLERTGMALEPEALAAYRLLWALTDVAAFTTQLRRPHQHDADAISALAGIRSLLEGGEPAPYGPHSGPTVRG